MGMSPKGSCEKPLSVVEVERNRNLSRESWESPSFYGGEDVKVLHNQDREAFLINQGFESLVGESASCKMPAQLDWKKVEPQ